ADARRCVRRLLSGHAKIRAVARLAGGQDQVELAHAALSSPLQAAYVGHQRRVDHAGMSANAVHDFLSISQGGYGLGGSEAGDFDARKAAGRKCIHQGDLVRRGHLGFFDLQPVTRADFVDFHLGGAVLHARTPRARKSASVAASKPASANTASVCSPKVGARSWMPPGLSESRGNTAGISTSIPLAPRKRVMAPRSR